MSQPVRKAHSVSILSHTLKAKHPKMNRQDRRKLAKIMRKFSPNKKHATPAGTDIAGGSKIDATAE